MMPRPELIAGEAGCLAEGRRPLFQHGSEPFLGIGPIEIKHLHGKGVLENGLRATKPVIERPLCRFDRMLRPRCESLGDRERFFKQIILRNTLRDQTDSLCLRPINEISGHQVILRFCHAAQKRPDDHRMIASG